MKKAALFLFVPTCVLLGTPIEPTSPLDTEESMPLSKCDMRCSRDVQSDETEHSLLVFLSFSVPVQSWFALSRELEAHNGAFVLRGAPDNGLKELFLKIKGLREKGVVAPVLIDPESFEKHEIASVPSIILRQGDRFDRVTGNVPIAYALRLFSEGNL